MKVLRLCLWTYIIIAYNYRSAFFRGSATRKQAARWFQTSFCWGLVRKYGLIVQISVLFLLHFFLSKFWEKKNSLKILNQKSGKIELRCSLYRISSFYIYPMDHSLVLGCVLIKAEFTSWVFSFRYYLKTFFSSFIMWGFISYFENNQPNSHHIN